VTHPLAGKTTASVAVMLGLLAVPYLSPHLARFRVARAPWEKADKAAEIGPVNDTVVVPPPVLTEGETKLKASENEATVTNALPNAPATAAGDGSTAPTPNAKALAKAKNAMAVAIDDPSGHALDAFYTQLARTRAKGKGAITRILHYGDSVLVSDYISGTMRRRMQADFGDSGHGFLLVANPWEWYFHNDVAHGAGVGWSSSRITGPLAKDGMYGVGGVTFTGSPGATAYFGTSEQSKYGRKVSRFDIYYLETPNGGDIDVKIAGNVEKFSTKGEAKVSRVKSFPVTDGEAKMSLRVVSGNPRLFGVALERDEPGVVYDALGANGARAELLSGIDETHFGEQMALRKPSLIVLQYGTNESEAPGIAADYEKNLTAVIDKIKAAAPSSSILVVAPLDRAETTEGGALRTKPVIKKLVAAQKRVAEATHVAFWNTFEAMGGEGSMAKWAKNGLGGGDLTHPSPAGAEVIGDLFYQSLRAGFNAWGSSHSDAGASP